MLKKIYKNVIITSCAVAFVTVLVHFFVKSFTFNLLDALFGVTAGMLICILRFKSLYDSIQKSIDAGKELAKTTSLTGYVGRYILTAICLIVAVLYKVDTFATMAITLILATQVGARMSVPQNEKKGGSEGER